MDPISNNAGTSNRTFSFCSGKKEASTTPVPTDVFTSSPQQVKSGESWMTAVLNTRFPTATKIFPKEEVDKIMERIQPGDVVMISDDSQFPWQVLVKTSFGSDYNHAAIYEGNGNIIHADSGNPTGVGVVRFPLRDLLTSRQAVKIIRPDYKTPEDVKAALDFAREQLGKPFDGHFKYGDDSEFYCSELVKRSLDQCPNKVEVPVQEKFGTKGVSPGAFDKIPGAETVYTSNHTFLKSVISQYPVFIPAGTAAMSGSPLGPLGIIGGFTTGGILSIMTGNYAQTGHFNLEG